MSMDFNMTMPEEMARLVSRNLRETGMAYAEKKRVADEAKNIAKREPKLVAIAVRKCKMDIGVPLTDQSVKDYAATCPQVEKAEMDEEKAVYEAHKAEIAYDCAKADKDLLKGLLFRSGREEG